MPGGSCSAYINDSCLQGTSRSECQNNVVATVELMDSLGLTVHPKKSVLIPRKQITFLGFILCSETMSVCLTTKRIEELLQLCKHMLKQKMHITIRKFAILIGKMVAAEPGVEHAPLFYKPLEKIKDTELRCHNGNFDRFMTIPSEIKPILKWWISNLPNAYKLISHGTPNIVLYSNASKQGWDAVNKTENTKTGGQWSPSEQQLHINVLELKACQLALLSLCKNQHYSHIQIYTDNTTSCTYINKYGGKMTDLDKLARDIWMWFLEHNVYLTAAHIPGTSNSEADKMSRSFNEDLEWALVPQVFQKILDHFPDLSIDLFASRLNHKLAKYVSFQPEPSAFAVNAFSIEWTGALYYIFSPFSLISKVLQKLEEDKTEAVMIAPLWTTQVWWEALIKLISGPCFSLPHPQTLLHLPQKPERVHPLKKMRLGVCRLSTQSQRSSKRGSRYHHGVMEKVNKRAIQRLY